MMNTRFKAVIKSNLTFIEVLAPSIKQFRSFSLRTVFATVISLVSVAALAQTSTAKLQTEEAHPYTQLSGTISIERSMGLYNNVNDERDQALEVVIAPVLQTFWGTFSYKQAYDQDLRDENNKLNGFSDGTISYKTDSIKWISSVPLIQLTIQPSLYATIPMSKASLKDDELQGSLGTVLLISTSRPNVLGQIGSLSASLAISAGRNFHRYTTSAIGKNVLNKYSSNQTLDLGYSVGDFSLSFQFINKSRWTYENNVKQYFVANEELGYAINPHFSLAIGHTNEASALSARGDSSNISLINENTSSVYISGAASF